MAKIENKEKIFSEMIDKLAQGEMLARLCEQKKYLNKVTFFRTLAADPEKQKLYNFARRVNAEIMLEKAYNSINELDLEGKNNKQIHWAVQHLKTQFDAAKWMAAKLIREYGDKPQEVNVGGQEGNPVIHEIRRVIIDPKKEPK